MSVDAILAGLTKVRRSGDGAWSACCPAHEDRSPSLAVKETPDGRILLHCFGGCSVDSVLGALGMDMADLFPPKPAAHGGGHQRVRRPWTAQDLLRLAAFESMVVGSVGVRLAADRPVSEADRGRMFEAIARLGDVASAING